MRHPIAALIALVSVAMLAAQMPFISRADLSGRSSPVFYDSALAGTLYTPPNPDEQVTVMIELRRRPASQAPTLAAMGLWGRALAIEQAALIPRLTSLGARVLFQARLAYNGIAVVVPASQIDGLRALPAVAGIHVIIPKRRALATALPTVGAPTLWEAAGATGRDIRIGIVDSGIDYTHADFGGPGTPEAYATNNRAILEPGTFPTTRVIGGHDFAGDAYDASDPAHSTPVPDPDPLDCDGHGTHVAGVAAGSGVRADGSTYSGPYTPDLDLGALQVAPGVAPEAQLYALKVFGCSMGTTALVTLAIERALDPNGDDDPSDRLDVLNLSLGSPFGGPDDPDAVAVNNAVQLGMVVVTSVGDAGEVFYSVSSPASASGAIAVGATQAADPAAPTMRLAPFSARGPQRGNGAIKPDLVAPGVGIHSAAVGTGNAATAMSGTSIAAPLVAGAAALVRQMHPDWSPTQIKAALMNSAAPVAAPGGAPAPPSLGGAGRLALEQLAALDLLAYAPAEGSVGMMFGAPWLPAPTTLTRILQLENHGDLARTLTINATSTVTEPGVAMVLPPQPITLAPHSQLQVPIGLTIDPRALDFTPDSATALMQATLPNQRLDPRYFMAEHGGYLELRHGGDARIRAANATRLDPITIFLDDQLLDQRLGAGNVGEYRVVGAGTHTLRVHRSPSDPDPILTAQVQLEHGHDYSAVIAGRDRSPGVILVDDTPPTLPRPGQALMRVVNANVDATNPDIDELDVWLDGTRVISALEAGGISAFIPLPPGAHRVEFYPAGAQPHPRLLVAARDFSVESREVVLIGVGRDDTDDRCTSAAEYCRQQLRVFLGRGVPGPVDGALLRVPFTIFPKSASDAHAIDAAITVPRGAPLFAVGLRNLGARNSGLAGSRGTPQTPLASAFELAAVSPPITPISPTLRAADVRYLGVTTNLSETQDIADTTIFFGLATYGPWSTPNELELRVYLDTDLDPLGRPNYVLINRSRSALANQPANDVFVSALYEVLPGDVLRATGSFAAWDALRPPTVEPQLDPAPFNTAVMFHTTSTRFLGITPAQPRFRYYVETRARDAGHFGRVVDRVPAVGALEYDLTRPAIAPINGITPILEGLPLFLDLDGAQIGGVVNSAVLVSRGNQPMLVLHHHNPPGTQAELVEMIAGELAGWNGLAPVEARRLFAPLMQNHR